MATSNDTGIKPDHVIIWLDTNMSVDRNNRPSKIDLVKNARVDCLPSDERSGDIDNFIDSVDQNMNNDGFNNVNNSPLRMFTDKDECMKCIDDNLKAKKQPFLIVSGAMGAKIVPEIYPKLSGYIYICCGRRDLHSWTDEYSNHLEVYDDETGVFARVLSDIGIHYIKKTEETSANETYSIEYLRWARRLVMRAIKLDKFNREGLLQEINNRLATLESSQSNNNDNDDQTGQDADEG